MTEEQEPLPDVHVMAINVTARLAAAKEGWGRIECWLDENADETQDYAKAAYAVIEWQFGGWTTIPLSDWVEDLTIKPN